MDNVILSGALAFLITFFSIPVIIQIAKEKKLYDEPDERKVHKVVIPTLGGLGIFAGFIIALLMGMPAGSLELQYLMAAALIMFFMGIKDDILDLSASKKFIGQLICAGIVIKFGGLQIRDMHGFLGINEIPNVASWVLTLFTIIVVTNAFNLIDGVDGLAGTLGLITTFTFGLYFLAVDNIGYAVLAFSLSASTIAFLIYNFSPAKIFMGDTGSLLLGLMNSVLVIKFINVAGAPSSAFPVSAAPAIGFAILLVPLFDTLRVFGIRILNRRSPFSADRNHIHHFLLDLGFSHRKITLSVGFAAIGFILVAFTLHNLSTTLLIGILLTISSSITALVYRLRKKSQKNFVSTRPDKKIITTHKILNYPAQRTSVPEVMEVDG